MAFYVGRGFPKIFVSTLRESRYNRVSVVHFSSQELAFAPKSRNKSKARKPQLSKKLRLEFEKYKDQHPVISCQRTEFNFYEGMEYDKFEPVPLASQGWFHRKSCGDFFSLYKDCAKPHETVHFGNVPIIKKNVDGSAEEQTHYPSSFEDLGISPRIAEAVKRMEICTPADVQVAAIPSVLKGKNTVISAHTGCGKTLAFLLPLVQQVLHHSQEIGLEAPFNSPKALIITPTRELAAQISDVLSELTEELPVNCRLLVGGEKMDRSLKEVDILVGSLGVVWKHVALGAYKLKNLIHVVLDEADALVDDKNYERVVRLFKRILVRDKPNTKGIELSHGCQLTLVSATIPTNLSRTFEDIVKVEDLERITTTTLHHVPTNVPQTFLRVGSPNKAKALLDLVGPDHSKKTTVIIFRRRKDMLGVTMMSQWPLKMQEQFMDISNRHQDPQQTPQHPSAGPPVITLPGNITLPRNIEYSLVSSSARNGDASTSSHSPTWSHTFAEIVDDDSSEHSTQLSEKMGQPVQDNSLINGSANSLHSQYPQHNGPSSENEDSHEFKPDINELQNISQNGSQNEFMSVLNVVREVVRQEIGSDDEDTYFGKSIALMLKRMNRSKKNHAKVRLLQLLREIDEENE